ncbi:hypothetical protein GRI97_07860 [Altererythrobacter xixiisoli]|uniref:Uncharacterized protein n=1 Tax=Croceibacterium xixiisoli TaxID=1476466 RepID=A0A6I4TUK5_9SPHN|nr:hypothetical protein [Croceibacterium xixiisoli]MXO98900.1 hypothetical protein [Croceibacterium xixiisoli]
MLKSLIAGAIAAALGLLSMGLLGGLLYYAAFPVLFPLFGNINGWSGDNVWPATIGAGMLWGLAFPIAGLINRRLARQGTAPALRRACYALVLWVGAALVWIAMAGTMDIRLG